MTYNTALLGLGNIAWKLDEDPLRNNIWTHAKAYYLNNNTNLIAACDNNIISDNAIGFHKKYPEVKLYNNLEQMFSNNNIDIVSICVPTSQHQDILYEIAKYPIKAVFCEKPCGYDMQIEELYKRENIVIAVNYMRRWDSLYLNIKKIIDSKELGELKSIVSFTSTALYMNASHMIDLINWFGGGNFRIQGRVKKDYIREVDGNKDYGGVFYFYNKNIDGFLYAHCDNKEKFQFEITLYFTNGKIMVLSDGLNCAVNKYEYSNYISNYKTLNYDRSLYSSNERMLDAIKDIINVIENKKEKINCGIKEAKEVQQFINKCYYAAG